MMITKDRYTHAFLLVIMAVVIAAYFFRIDNKQISIIALLLSPIYLAYIVSRSGRVHNDGYEGTIAFKAEEGCGFVQTQQENIDGVATNTKKRFKVIDGADVVITENGDIIPAGPGSQFMTWLGKGGYEPESIQNDNCWLVPN